MLVLFEKEWKARGGEAQWSVVKAAGFLGFFLGLLYAVIVGRTE